MAPDGRVVSAGAHRRVRVWDPHSPGLIGEMACTATKIAFVPGHNQDEPNFALAHDGYGISVWSLPRP